MTVPHARGACPRLAKPMQTGDGLLARLVTAGPIPLDAFIGLCAATQEHGNGMMEISSRGSLQVRGLTPVSAPLFAFAVAGLDIELCERAPVLSGPLPDDPAALIDADVLASSLRRAIAAHELRLAPKVSVVIDGGGCLHLDALTADLRLRAIESAEGTRLHVSIAGDAASATPLDLVALDDAIDIAMRILALIATSGPAARAADLLQSDGIGNFGKAAGNRMARAAPLPRRQRAEPIGLHRLRGKGCAIGVALALGQASAGDLMAFAGVARANKRRDLGEACSWSHPSPWAHRRDDRLCAGDSSVRPRLRGGFARSAPSHRRLPRRSSMCIGPDRGTATCSRARRAPAAFRRRHCRACLRLRERLRLSGSRPAHRRRHGQRLRCRPQRHGARAAAALHRSGRSRC